MNTRRKIVLAFGASALAVPLASFAQQQVKVWRVGFLASRKRPESLETDQYGGFPNGMRQLGYVESKNLVIEYRWADKTELLPIYASELVQLNVDVIVTAGSPATSAAQKVTSSIPIVMGSSGDPIGSGFAKSLARPGGNITGITNLTTGISPKQLEMLSSMTPKLSRVAVLTNPANSAHAAILKSIRDAAQAVRITIHAVEARTPQEIENVFSRMSRQGVRAAIVALDPLFIQQWRQIAELTTKYRVSSITASRDYPETGGLMSYGPNYTENFRRAATYVDKILKGVKPANLPIEQPTRFELIINGKTAKSLGLKIPQSLLITADKVIE
jgi:putative tryptophan/tyrosine transport system substrate-binding protein